jgi:hypothetical protein
MDFIDSRLKTPVPFIGSTGLTYRSAIRPRPMSRSLGIENPDGSDAIDIDRLVISLGGDSCETGPSITRRLLMAVAAAETKTCITTVDELDYCFGRLSRRSWQSVSSSAPEQNRGTEDCAGNGSGQ